MDHKASPVKDLLGEFLQQIPREDPTSHSMEKPWVVILTGSTGSLGTHILSALQMLPPTKVQKIYCLNRSQSAEQAQAAAFLLRGLPPLDGRVEFIQVTFGQPNFGLSKQWMQQLMGEVTLIIHNAWPVDFLKPLENFKPHIEGVRDFLRLSYQAPHHPHFLFISSLGIAYSSNMGHITEDVAVTVSAVAGGYSQSKYIAERMVEAYVRSTGLPAAILRVGQIAGPVHSEGVWPHREWFPTLLRASKHIGVLPKTLGPHSAIDWIPVDILSQIAVEIAEYVVKQGSRPHTGSPLVFNIANPATAPFDTLLPYLGTVAADTVACDEWVELLQRSVADSPDSKIAGKKLLGFYKTAFAPGRLPIKTVTQNTTLASETARNLQPVSGLWLLRWLDQWGLRPKMSRL